MECLAAYSLSARYGVVVASYLPSAPSPCLAARLSQPPSIDRPLCGLFI